MSDTESAFSSGKIEKLMTNLFSQLSNIVTIFSNLEIVFYKILVMLLIISLRSYAQADEHNICFIIPKTL